MLWLENFLYPRLLQFPVEERANALRKAREQPLDVIELIGIAAGLILATALTRYLSLDWKIATRVGVALFTFVMALPILSALVAPFLVRRVRRGLDLELTKRTFR